MKSKAVIWQEDGVWCGSVPALPGCHTWGESYDHLLEMIEDAVRGWFDAASQRLRVSAWVENREPAREATSQDSSGKV